MRPYDSYKRSGVPWLTEIPEHWELKRLKFVATTIAGQSPPSEIVSEFTGRYPFLQGNAEFGPISPNPKLSCETPNKFAEQGDILLSVRAPVGAINIADQRYGIGRGICAIRAEGTISRKFLHHSLTATKETLREASTGSTYDAVSVGDVGNIATPIPPSDEQTAIVRFLDHADEQIGRYIAGKERLIALLEEERQALVHQAVTRGLDPTVRLKPSGVEWLGDIPEHWGIQRLKTVCGMKSGEGITGMSIEDEGEFPVYGGNGLRGYTSEFTHDGEYVLIGRQGALCGNVHIARGQFWASEHAVVTTLYENHVLEWLSGLLEVMNLNQYSIAAAQPGLAVERVMNLWIPVPPPEEQKTIAASIGTKTKRIDNTVKQARSQTDLMNEYRTRLIADVVTGQLDVREAAAQLQEAPWAAPSRTELRNK